MYNFIPDEVFQDLPEDRGARFKLLLETAREQFDNISKGKVGEYLDRIAVAYMSQVSVIARELGFSAVPVAIPPLVPSDWDKFETSLSGILTRIQLKSGKSTTEFSVSLSKIAKFRIEQEIERLRELIDGAELPEKKKRSLKEKLDERVEELRRERLSFAKLAAIAAAVAGVFGGSSATLANGPRAIETIGKILHWVGEEKAAEEGEQLRLTAPPKALPPPRSDSNSKSNQS